MFWNSTIYPKQINHRVYQIHKEGGVVNIFWQLDDIFEPPGRNELIVWKTDSRFFSLASHARWACEARALRTRKTLTPRFTDFFTDFEKKTDCFAV